MTEDVGHPYEHFEVPCTIWSAAYMPPTSPSFSIEMKPSTLDVQRYRD